MDAQQAVADYMAAWAEPDEDKRRELLEGAWADDGVYLDPSAKADGRDALIKHISGFQQTFAGHELQATSGVDAHDGYLRFAWRMRDPDGNQIMEGVDFGTLADDGRISSIIGFFGPWPDVGPEGG